MNRPMTINPTDLRIGQGYDVHAFAEGRRLVLGGVDIPHVRGLLGHSDADVLAHAVADALSGTSASCFPTTTRPSRMRTR